jgi:hypothetical protein
MPDNDDAVIETEPPDPGVADKPSIGQVGEELQEEADEASDDE